ncbi:S9 family peptidase [Sphingosinicella rhizophila]|uniref:S9 family peptidase n=1 Tax=Sphingosinicella rhizophila TaxID=3050082 RepID=A0ABU3Q2G5_9SPHN|nr:S9 family peptidase [Sphingosinicella sp. GR2756]MDT9597578.1 S9 family peptidase [Sphingosinicella sp. GR2756]
MRTLIITAAALVAAAPAAGADLNLERLFESPSLNGATPRLPKLSPDGRLATLLRNRADDKDRYDLWAVDTSTGASRMLVDSARIGSGAEVSEEEKMRRERARIAGTKGITSYEWAPDGKTILVPIDGDLYLADLAGTVRRMTETSGTEIDAKVSATGRFLSFTRDQNLYVLDIADGTERQLTKDGGGALSWGAAEFVAQEELNRDTGYWWSPDDLHLAVARVDESKVKVVTRTAIGADGTKTFEQRYPAAGTPNATVELYVMTPDGGGRVKVDLGKDPDFYLARVDWSADGKVLLVQRLSRDQKKLDLLHVDPVTGRSNVLASENSRAWINLNHNLKPLKDGSFLWSSERSGFPHLYRWKAGEWTQLTRGDWAVEEVVGVDERARRVYFTGTAETPLEQQLYWVGIDRPGSPARLTESGWWNNATIDKDATRAIIFRSSPAQPEQVFVADMTGKRLTWIEENKLDPTHPYAPYLNSHVAPVFGTIKAKDGSDLYYRLFSPPREPGRRYPVFVDVYGGPHGQKVTRSWSKDLARHQYLVDRGWIVMTLDGRGTNRRGVQFESQIYRAMGGVEVEDQLSGVEWLKRQEFVDPARLAVMGWSYGGYMVLKLLEAAPGVFAAGAAVAPVTKWEYYDTAYTERYLGNPATDPAPYRRSNALDDAGKIEDPLLVMHGMADDNVVFENTTALIAKLQTEKKPFEMMVYPGAAHAIAGEGPQTHVWRTIENFLERTVKAKP